MKPKTQNWIDLAQEDLEVAGHLFDKKKYLHCLFFCQQSIEKIIKAVYYEKYKKTPPRKHDLEALADAAGILAQLNDGQASLLDTLSLYYIESRYAEDRESLANNCTQAVTKSILDQTEEIFEWLKKTMK
ncbi:HEPN domain protein [Pelotomaculum sp. FP]|uniref:HEPN domain-containing protein n=1 Tax=Pelotomaculum sp. FP TaxID=261474 RepID=UPI001064D73E|nr:HEPN domain-containing protein [Pelotomaculum sp. FP]TEB15228.1 HEPN domain protein [Pelotomaculum sp. FP]